MKRLAVLMAAAVMILGTQLYGQPNEAKQIKKFMEKLNLTDEQKKDVEKIHFDAKKQTITQKAKVETAGIELRQLLKADAPDKSAIEKKINDIAVLRVQMHMIKINSWFAINKLLTPDQQKIWKKALGERQAFRQHKMMKHGIMKRMDKRGQPSTWHEQQMSK